MGSRFGLGARRKVASVALAVVAALALASCGDAEVEEDTLQLRIFTTSGAQLPPVAGLETVRISALDHSRNEVLAQQEFAYSKGSANLGGIAYAEELQLVIEGMDALGQPLMRGASTPFEYTRDNHDISPPHIFVSPIDAFSTATALTEAFEGLQPQEVRFQVATPRGGHSVVELSNGLLLITGGAALTDAPEGAAVEVPGLPDGVVVDTGEAGGSFGVLDAVELYDPATGLFFERPPMRFPRAFHTSTLLADGRVLISGGVAVIEKDDGLVVETLTSAEIIDPRRPSEPAVLIAGPGKGMNEGRAWHTATLRRSDGRVVVIGGRNIADGESAFLATAEMFNPETETFELNPGDEAIEMERARAGHTAELLLSGRGAGKSVIVIGGENDDGSLRGTEVLKIVGNDGRSSFEPGPSMVQGRHGHRSLVPVAGDGALIAVVGGTDSDGDPLEQVELMDINVGEFEVVTRLGKARAGAEVIELPQTGDVIVIGGLGADGAPVGTAERLAFDALTLTYDASELDGSMIAPRGLHRATRLSNGLILITGGVGQDGGQWDSLDIAEFFNADDGGPGFSRDDTGGFIQ